MVEKKGSLLNSSDIRFCVAPMMEGKDGALLFIFIQTLADF